MGFNWLEAYLEFTQHSEAPRSFHYWTGISAIAGALRRKVCIDMGYFRWYPNFFLCFVAPPGIVSKSTTADIGMSLLRKVPGIKFGPSTVTWQALVTALAESREDYPNARGEFIPQCALTLVASELGSLIQPGDQSMINLLTDLWDGKDDPFTKRTKKDGEEIIVNPWVNLVGCTTPAWIAENFNSYFVGGGFSSRTLFVYSEHKRQLVAYPAKRYTVSQTSLGEKLINELERLAGLSGKYQLSKDAIAWGTSWYATHHSSDNPLRLDPRFGGYFARKQTHIHKTAMVISAAERGDLVIRREDLETAEKEVTDLEPNMLAVFGEMNKEKITEQMASVLQMAREKGIIRRDHLYADFITRMGYGTFNECIEGLLAAGLIEMRQEGSSIVIAYKAMELERKLQ